MMNKLYRGKLAWSEVPKAIKKVEEVRTKLANFAPHKVIWHHIYYTTKIPKE